MRQALRYILLLVMTITTSKAMAQADAQFTQYWAVQNYYNAAATGTSDFINIRGGTRQQWVGIEGAPKSFLVTAESPFKFLGKRFGAGLIMHQESIGLYRTLNIDLQLSYKIKLFKGQLSAGVQFGYIDQTFKNVTATCEFFYANEESLEQNLRNSLQMLGIVRTVFMNDMAELSE